MAVSTVWALARFASHVGRASRLTSNTLRPRAACQILMLSKRALRGGNRLSGPNCRVCANRSGPDMQVPAKRYWHPTRNQPPNLLTMRQGTRLSFQARLPQTPRRAPPQFGSSPPPSESSAATYGLIAISPYIPPSKPRFLFALLGKGLDHAPASFPAWRSTQISGPTGPKFFVKKIPSPRTAAAGTSFQKDSRLKFAHPYLRV